jgi:NAD-dependent deacetylase
MLGDMDPAIGAVRALLSGARRVVVLSGAGISTASGIPGFRGPDGLWTKDPGAEMLASYDAYVTDQSVRERAWQARLTSPTWAPAPNDGHRVLVELERTGVLDALITQNIDGLHQLAGSDPSLIIEIHGNGREAVCLRCRLRRPMTEVLERVAAGERDPACDAPTADGTCGGILKSATISFGQSLVAVDLVRAEQAARRCDLLLAIGTTLAVFPAANVVPLAARAGAPVVIINGEATAMDDLATVIVRGDITASLLALLGEQS